MSNVNMSYLLGVCAISLASGYYIGQLCSRTNIPSVLSNGSEEERLERIKKTKDKNTSDIEDANSEFEENSESDDIEIDSTSLNCISGEVRMTLVIRQDLGMTKGKIAAQCCHAALACYRKISENNGGSSYNPHMVSRWLSGGQAKITLKCPDKGSMDELYAKALAYNVNCYIVHDAGRTQIASGSATVLGLGPAPKAVLDEITGQLKLY